VFISEESLREGQLSEGHGHRHNQGVFPCWRLHTSQMAWTHPGQCKGKVPSHYSVWHRRMWDLLMLKRWYALCMHSLCKFFIRWHTSVSVALKAKVKLFLDMFKIIHPGKRLLSTITHYLLPNYTQNTLEIDFCIKFIFLYLDLCVCLWTYCLF